MLKKNLLLLISLFWVSMVTAQHKPDILWIITDDHRTDALQCYNVATTGNPEGSLGEVLSPNIDKLAAEGTLFTAAYCNSPMCTPSRASMQTGRYPFRNGHYKFYSHQEADFVKPTVSQILRNEGYGTAVFGKAGWGIYKNKDGSKNTDSDFYDLEIHFEHLQQKGYGDIFYSHGEVEFIEGIFSPIRTEETIIYPNGTRKNYLTQLRDAPMPENDKQLMKAVDEEFDILRSYTRLNKALILGGVNPQPAEKTVDAYVIKEFEDYLTNTNRRYTNRLGNEVQGADTNKPVFINLGFHLPHTPVLPPKEYRDIFKDKHYKFPVFNTDQLSNFPPQLVTLYNECKADQLTDEEKLQAIRDYYAFCAFGDALIGEAVEAFKSYCQRNNRKYLVIFTVGDHGWHLGEQGIMAKFGPWKESIHDAAIVVSSDKELFKPGTVSHDIVEFVDFTPTILAAAGVDIHSSHYQYLDGYDLAEVVEGKAVKREYALGEVNVVCGHRAYMRCKDFAFSMRTRDKWDVSRSPFLNNDITWALTCSRHKADMALYDLRNDPLELHNLAYTIKYEKLADWFRVKLGNIVLGDGRVECDWSKPNSYNISSFAGGADDKKLDIPEDIIPAL